MPWHGGSFAEQGIKKYAVVGAFANKCAATFKQVPY